MLNKVKQMGLAKFAGDEDLAKAFVEGFQKQAAAGGIPAGAVLAHRANPNNKSEPDEFSKGLYNAVGKGVGSTITGLALWGLNKTIGNVQQGNLHNEFMQSLSNAIAHNPVLRQADKDKVVNYAETVFKFAPNVATDSNLLSSILANAVHGDGIDPMTIRTITDLEGRYTDNNKGSFSPKTYV